MKHLLFPVLLFTFYQTCQAQFSADLAIYKSVILNDHKNPFTQTDKDQWLASLDALIGRSDGLSREACIVELMKINALIGDEHTLIQFNQEATLPVRFRLFEDGLYVISTTPEDQYVPLLLHQLKSINGHTSTEIITHLNGLIKQDNPKYTQFFIAHYLNRLPILQPGHYQSSGARFVGINKSTDRRNDYLYRTHPAAVS
jgi:hypothetical protein